MKKKLVSLLGTAIVGMAALCGCGASTETVVDKMFAEQADSLAMTVDMDVDISAKFAGSDIDLALTGTTDLEFDSADKDEVKSHIKTDLKVSAMGESEKLKTEIYTITEDDEATAYLKDPDSGDWTYTTSEVEENPMDEKTIAKVQDSIKEVLKTAELQKKTEKIGDEECYVLRLDTTADSFGGCFDAVWDTLDDDMKDEAEDAGFDMDKVKDYLSYFKTDITIYTSKKSGKAVKMIVDMTGTDTEGLLGQVEDDFGDMLDMFGVDIDDIDLTIDSMKFDITYSSWNEVTVEIPKKVKDNATEAGLFADDFDDFSDFDDFDDFDDSDDQGGNASGDLVNPDGSITLYSYMDKPIIDVNVPNGYELSEYASNTWVQFTNDDWESISVSEVFWLDWDDVVNEGEQYESDGYYYYSVVDDDGNIKMVIDLDEERDGYPVYATLEGKLDDNNKLSYADLTIAFRYDDDDDWVEVYLPDSSQEWDTSKFIDVYHQLFD